MQMKPCHHSLNPNFIPTNNNDSQIFKFFEEFKLIINKFSLIYFH